MYSVYILYSSQIDKFYIGQTVDLENRLIEHNKGIHDKSFTKRATDWELFVMIECTSRKQSLKIEKHLKSMKSRTYYNNLRIYPEITQKLLINSNK